MSAASVLQSSPASIDLLRTGSVVFLAAGATTIAVPDTAITANSIVVCCGLGAADGTALTFTVDVLSAGVGFSIRTNAAATAAKSVGFAVLKY